MWHLRPWIFSSMLVIKRRSFEDFDVVITNFNDTKVHPYIHIGSTKDLSQKLIVEIICFMNLYGF